MEVLFNGETYQVGFTRYQTTNNLALMLKDTIEGETDIAMVASVNTDFKLKDDVICIKGYSENEGIVDALIEGGVIEDIVVGSYPTGYVKVPIFSLTKESRKEIENLGI